MDFIKTITVALALVLASHVAMGQYAAPADSSDRAFRATQLIAPGVVGGAGVMIHFLGHDAIDVPVRDWAQDLRGDGGRLGFDNYLQYAPLAMDLGLGLVGASARHDFLDRSIECALAFAACGVCAEAGKYAFRSLRPDEVDYHSFPSGHTTVAFTGAELVRMEYGWGWGSAAYAMSTTVAAMRLYNNKHWLSDVLFGAGLGILCAHVGEWLLEPSKNLLGISRPVRAAVAPAVDPNGEVSLCAGLEVVF